MVYSMHPDLNNTLSYNRTYKNPYNQSNYSYHANYHPRVITSQNTSPKSKNMLPSLLGATAVGIGIGVAALLLKGKTKAAKQLAEHITFTEAKSIKEAQKFAETNLGVNLKNMQDLKVTNFINECLVNLSNKTKGKVLLPKTIKISNSSSFAAGRYNPLTDSVILYQNSFGDVFAKDFDIIKRNYKYLLDDRIMTLYHEIGHGVQVKKTGLIKGLYPSKNYRKQVNDIREPLLKYLGDGTDITSRQCTHYIDNPSETYAQIFAKKMTGNPPTGKVAELFESLGGTDVM